MKKLLRSRVVTDYGSVLVLILLCAYYSVVTLREQHPITAAAGRQLAKTIVVDQGAGANVLIVTRDTAQDREFAAALADELTRRDARILDSVAGNPSDARLALEAAAAGTLALDAVATNHPASRWGPLQPDSLRGLSPRSERGTGVRVYKPPSYVWPSFLTRANLLNVVKNNAEIAVIAIGMTMVIITAGIDLSVGSVLALCGVVTAVGVQGLAGGADATMPGLILAALLGLAACAFCGAFNGLMVTLFQVPAFVVTLAMMMIARGLALIVAVRYQSMISGGATEGTPEAVKIEAEAFGWLGNGQVWGVPNPILIMALLYVLAHLVMTRTSIGRYIYAVGGNKEAARLSGVPVTGVLILVYTICGAMAGLGGVLDASRFEGGRPNAGELYELQVIAAVVVGGTSLAGGEGRIFGTLIGALIIAVIQNGLNMAGVKPYEQMVIFGLLILGAVLADVLRKGGWKRA